MKRFLYFGYYLKKLDRKAFRKFLAHVRKTDKRPLISILWDVLRASFKYNISLLEYFQFGFYELNAAERSKWAGTGYMYEYQQVMNPEKHRQWLVDKRLFLDRFAPFVKHNWGASDELVKDFGSLKELFNNPSGKLVLKRHDGQCGLGVKVVKTTELQPKDLLKLLKTTGNNLVEEYIVQHPDLMRLSPSGLNTIRIYTQLNALDEVEILGCRIRISINSVVDNMAAGNIAAPIDDNTGIVTGPGVYSDITKSDTDIHPVTKTQITGFHVPFWAETLEMIKKATMSFKECRSIGWDIAITENGPELIEGNHDWCKLVWQLPVKKGLKPVLERHLKELKNK